MEDLFEIFEEILSDDDEDMINIIEMPRNSKVFRERPNHMEIYDDKEFVDRFRISKASVMELLNQIEHIIAFPTERNEVVGSLCQLLLTLRFYASGCMLVGVGDFGGIHKSTMSRIVNRVSQAIASLHREYIKMPHTDEEIRNVKNEFYRIARFPKVIGTIDCTHVKIQSPGGENGENYRNRKGYFSINVQTVSDARLKIRNIVARWPGAAHDSTIFNNSRLKAELENNNIYQDCFILGDSGYALKDYLMTPLRNPTTRTESLYNESHIRTRNTVERKYGVWKRRFPCLSLGIRLKLQRVLTVIVATAVLHNIAIDMNDDEPEGPEFIQEDEVEDEIIEGNGDGVRQILINNYFANLLQ